MDERAKGLVSQGVPWRRDARWQIVAVEAVVLIVIGAFILIDQDTARDVILPLIGIVLLVTSGLLGFATFRSTETGLGFFDAFRAGIGVTAGMVATASWWSDYIATHAARIILGWALVAYALLHVVGLIVVRGPSGLRLSAIVIVALTLVLGIVLLTGDDTTATSRLNLLGIVLLVFGTLLAALAYYLRGRGDDTAVAGAGP